MMKNNNIQMKKPAVFRLGSIFVAVSAAAAELAAANGFTDIPFYLQQKQEIKRQTLKPKVMLLIDDSGSMAAPAGQTPDGRKVNRFQAFQYITHAMLDKFGSRIQWSLQALHDDGCIQKENGKCNVNMDHYTDDAEAMKRHIDNMRFIRDSGTPTTRRYYEVSKFVMNQTKYRCDKNYIVLLSDGDANDSWRIDGQKFAEAMLYRCNNQSCNLDLASIHATPKFPISLKGMRDPYFGLIKAGKGNVYATANKDAQGRTYFSFHHYDDIWDRNDGLRNLSSILYTRDFKTSDTDGYGKSWNGDAKDPRDPENPNDSLYKKQLVETYTVGFGRELTNEGRKYLSKGASKSGNYFDAFDAEGLNNAFEQIFDEISGSIKEENIPIETTSSTPPAVSSRGVAGLAAAVQLNTGTWGGRLQFYRLNGNGTPADKTQFALPSFADRQTLINTGSKVYNVGKLTGSEFANADFGLPNMQGGTNKTEWLDLLRWTARIGSDAAIKAKSERGKYSRTYRVRSEEWRDLGDILDAPVVTAGQSEAGGYREFLATAANDGMVHLFVKTAGIHPYSLRASYLPAGMEREDKSGNATTLGKTLKDFADARYGSAVAHNYGVNGGLTMRQTPLSDGIGQRTFVFGAMGQGGRGAYALDVGSLKKGGEAADTLPLFETEKGGSNRLGYTFGTPQVGRVSLMRGDDGKADTEAQVRYAGFLASGYRVQQADHAQNETALYVYDMLGTEAGRGKTKGSILGKAGALLAKIKVDGVGGLSEPALVDTDFDGIVDVAYAGDRGGNMYRFDLRGKTPAQWSVSRIFKGTAQQPVMAAPAVSRLDTGKYVVIFGTGSDVYQDDAQNKARQAVYGIYDDVSAAAVDASSGDLLVQAKRRTNNLITLSDYPKEEFHRGWKVDLDEDGERVVVKPTMILRTAVVTTRKYTTVSVSHTDNETDKCLPAVSSSETSGETAIIGFNAENGGALTDRSARFLPPVNPRNGEDRLFHNGVVLKGLLGFAYLDPKRTDESPVTLDGDSGGSGTDIDLDVSPSIPNNRCFREVADRSLLLNSLDNFAVEGPECPKAKKLTRLSWREIFF